MTIEQKLYADQPNSIQAEINKLGRPMSLPNHHRIRLEDSPEKMIIQFLLTARAAKQPAVLREDMIAHLLPKYPFMTKEAFRVHMAAVTRIIKPEGCMVLNKKTGVNDVQDSRRYSLITEEERLKLERETKAKESNPQSLGGLSARLAGFKRQPDEIRSETQESRITRLAREEKEIEEKREIFINKFCASLVTQMASNVEHSSPLTANINRNLEQILESSNPFHILEKEKLIRLLGGTSMDYLRNFFKDAFIQKMTHWFSLEKQDLPKIPVREQAVIRACLMLKSKNITLNDALSSIFKHLGILTVSVEKPA